MGDRDGDTLDIPKISSKLLEYEGGRLPIRNVDDRGCDLEVDYMCDPSSLHKVIRERGSMYI